MKNRALGYFFGEKVPEGFAVALAQTVSTAQAIGYIGIKVDPLYTFRLDRIVARWAAPSVPSTPLVQIFRDTGQRSLSAAPVDFVTIANPGPRSATNPKGMEGPGAPLLWWFEAGTVIQGVISGYVANDPSSIHLVLFGRYIKKQQGGF